MNWVVIVYSKNSLFQCMQVYNVLGISTTRHDPECRQGAVGRGLFCDRCTWTTCLLAPTALWKLLVYCVSCIMYHISCVTYRVLISDSVFICNPFTHAWYSKCWEDSTQCWLKANQCPWCEMQAFWYVFLNRNYMVNSYLNKGVHQFWQPLRLPCPSNRRHKGEITELHLIYNM